MPLLERDLGGAVSGLGLSEARNLGEKLGQKRRQHVWFLESGVLVAVAVAVAVAERSILLIKLLSLFYDALSKTKKKAESKVTTDLTVCECL